MAKSIDDSTALLLSNLQSGEIEPERMWPADAVALAERGFISLNEEGQLCVTEKASRAIRRFEKEKKVSAATSEVRNVINEMLTEPGAVTQHRAVWNKVGRDAYERDTVLQALNNLKAEGLLENHRTSGNNFQVFWRRADDNVSTPMFETN